ncbi:MAG: hypothetical protein K5634_06040 [Sphaerochaetaceae bacterium]|nr:hypothetical protein [Sphaerochaetaceae bacterium]
MRNKIFKSIWIAAISVFFASLLFILGISYSYFTSIQKLQLKNQTELAAKGVSISGSVYLEELNPEGYRITWISQDGTVLYDNQANSEIMENHLERKEVMEALENGSGSSERYSNTLTEKQFYCARRLPDGSVIRLSIVQAAVWTLLLGFAQPICIVIIIAFLLSFFIASRLARKIVEPLNNIDIKNPEMYYGKETYREVEPLLRHISEQNIQLKKDKDLIEKNALIRQEFTANVSHELKTPLHVISGYAELIENGMVRDEDIKPFVRIIREESIRITKLVEDIIDLTKLDSGVVDLSWENCNLYSIAENVIESLYSEYTEKGISVTLRGSSSPLKSIPQLLYSITYNICDNAIKYNRPGGYVEVNVYKNDGYTILSVKDSGIGIEEQYQDRIFERFYRVDKSHSKEVGGTGLGLSIVKHALLILNGSVKVESSPETGTTFTVSIPS